MSSALTSKVLDCKPAGKHNHNSCLFAGPIFQLWHVDVVSGLLYSDDPNSWRGLAVVSTARLSPLHAWQQCRHTPGHSYFRNICMATTLPCTYRRERHHSPPRLNGAPSKALVASILICLLEHKQDTCRTVPRLAWQDYHDMSSPHVTNIDKAIHLQMGCCVL